MIRRAMKNLRTTFKRHRKSHIKLSKRINEVDKLHPAHHKLVVDSVKETYPALFERRK
jgi:hypothetical protein